MKVKMTLLNFFLVHQIRKFQIPAEFGHFQIFPSQNCQTLIQNHFNGTFIIFTTLLEMK